jgi:hypothetical protein
LRSGYVSRYWYLMPLASSAIQTRCEKGL